MDLKEKPMKIALKMGLKVKIRNKKFNNTLGSFS